MIHRSLNRTEFAKCFRIVTAVFFVAGLLPSRASEPVPDAALNSLPHPALLLIIESGQSSADASAAAQFKKITRKNHRDDLVPIVLDLAISRNRATAARFHVTNTPVLFCLSTKGLIVSRDESPITVRLVAQRGEELPPKASALDAEASSLEQAINQNPNDPRAQFDLANFLLNLHNDREAIPHLELIAHNETVETNMRVRAWVALARAHLWIAEPEKGRHEGEALIAILGPQNPEARAGGTLVLGMQDANLKRVALARQEFDEAIAAAPDSVYARQAAEERAKLPPASK